MSEIEYQLIPVAPPASLPHFQTRIAALRAAGAERFDPLRLQYIALLTDHAQTHFGTVKRILDTRVTHALGAFEERFELAKRDARETITRSVTQYPHAARDLERLFDDGDFKAVKRFAFTLESGEQTASLSALVRRLERHSLNNADARAEDRFAADAASRSELKTIREFRSTWSKLSVDKQVSQALEQAPSNAGPINSHMLVLRSLSLMRDISPDYLNRFMAYADALLCLDGYDKEKPAAPKKPRSGKK